MVCLHTEIAKSCIVSLSEIMLRLQGFPFAISGKKRLSFDTHHFHHVLFQAQQHMVAERNGGHRRQQAYITPTIATQAPYSFHHNSPSHTGNVHPHLAATHLPSQPHLYTYTAPAALGSTGTVAHLVASQGSARHTVQHGSYPPSLVHQVPVSMGHRVLPSPTLHHSQYQAQFAHQAYISASPASTVYTGYPLSPTKVNQYPYL